MLEQETIDWLKLSLVPEIGPMRGLKLLEKFKSPQAILRAPLRELAQVENVGKQVAERIVKNREKIDLENQLKLIEENKVKIIPLVNESYPEQLKATFDPPLVLFVKGEIKPLDYFSVAIVGTRLASVYGRQMSQKLSGQLVEKGLTVVSGGARGIDTEAHKTALRAGGRTIAVLGCGLDITYPSENKRLFEDISKNGALVSEFPLGTKPDKINFPIRNRIISGLSLGVVVIEAPFKSGALITVRHAIEQGREVFSVPGEADKFTSCGTNQLIRDGAKLVENAEDILSELQAVIRARMNEIKKEKIEEPKKQSIELDLKLNAEEQEVYNLIPEKNTHIDEIADKSRLKIGKVFSVLTRLELKKLIKQLPGKIFARI
ncbi:MAG: DNA-processing protein DprA [Candidatus Omnitrophota bacterium]|mgnify:CR=1 FL=1